jgi:hypothetical protein
VNPKEPFGQNSAGQIGAEFALDKMGDGGALLAGIGEKAFELFPNDLVKKRIL